MERRKFLAGAVAVSTPLVAGCGGDGDSDADGSGDTTTTDAGETTAAPGTTAGAGDDGVDETVRMVSTTFEPAEVSVDVGDTVEWVNEDSYEHDVTSAQFSSGATDWEFSESLAGGASTTHTFDSAGVYEYYCTIHGKSSMCGVVVVGDTTYRGSLPCRDGDGGGGGSGDGGGAGY